MAKKPVFVFTIADEVNLPYAKMLYNSFRKFHPDIPFHIIEGGELKQYLASDPQFFYRSTPVVAEKCMDEYDLVLKIDADSIITGSLQYVFDTKDYDIGTVINWNRIDPQQYGVVQGWGIMPIEYFNCGFVAMRNIDFVKHWKQICFSPQFERMQYREQDLLNILCYYGNYNVRCFDHGDGPAKMQAWWGLIAKGELMSAQIESDRIYIPKGEGNTPFPPKDMDLKVIHRAGGNTPNKMNYKTWLPERIMSRIDYLVSETK